MVQISNKTLATLLVVAMVVSVFGTISAIIQINEIAPLIQGAPTTGEVNITVTNQTAINVTIANVTWGSGNVDGGKTFATLNTVGEVYDGNWTALNERMRVENIGNNNVTLDISGLLPNDTFIGGTSPGFRFNVSDAETSTNGTCLRYPNYTDQYNEVPTGNNRICLGFDWRQSQDEIEIGFNLTIPEDSNTGSLNNTITFTATAV